MAGFGRFASMVAAVCASAVALGCTDEGGKDYVQVEHSGCLLWEDEEKGVRAFDTGADDGLYWDGWVEWSYDAADKELVVTHHDATFNCCPSGIRATAEVEGDVISLREEDYSTSGDWCGCECPYDVTSLIPDIAPGAYTLNIYYFDSETPCATAEIVAE